MISKELAEILSGKLLNDASANQSPIDSVIRRSGKPFLFRLFFFVAMVIMSGLISLWQHRHAEISMLNYLLIGLILIYLILMIVMLIYWRATPLLSIGEGVLIYYSNAPWKKKKFRLDEIISVTLSLSPNTWRGARQLSLRFRDFEQLLWLPDSHPSPLAQMQRVFRANFGELYVESVL